MSKELDYRVLEYRMAAVVAVHLGPNSEGLTKKEALRLASSLVRGGPDGPSAEVVKVATRVNRPS